MSHAKNKIGFFLSQGPIGKVPLKCFCSQKRGQSGSNSEYMMKRSSQKKKKSREQTLSLTSLKQALE